MCPNCRNQIGGCVHCRDQRRENARIGFQNRHRRTRAERLALGLIAGPIVPDETQISKHPIRPTVKPDPKLPRRKTFGAAVLPAGFSL